MKNEQIKYALVLSGGGFNGAFQLGALNYLNENWSKITGRNEPMHFDLIAGVSTGALNGVMTAMGKLSELNDLWINRIGKNGVSEIYTSNFIDTNDTSGRLRFKPNLIHLFEEFLPGFKIKTTLREKIAMLFSRKKRSTIFKRILKDLSQEFSSSLKRFKSIADNTPLRFKLSHLLDRSRIQKTRFFCGFVSLDSGEYHNVEHSQFISDNDFVKGVLASTSMPMIWQPVSEVRFRKNGNILSSRNNVDGGVRNVSPLGDLIHLINEDKESSYQIIVINCHSELMNIQSFDNEGLGSLTARSVYEIAFNEIFRNDIQHFTKVNDLVRQSKAWDSEIALFDKQKRELREFNTVIINPHKDVDLGNALVANEELINQRILHGRSMAELMFNQKSIHHGNHSF
ncbi:MAG: patatin-like phospholipase family protein [bacterium]|nr:patatin-like phospholipase family protein [bacterium]